MAIPKRMQIYLTEKQYRSLSVLSKKNKTSIAELIRQAINKYILEEEKVLSKKDPIWKIHELFK
jgi:metal-responsive CopG/Arc/MetJ family transcriptional regulator